MSANQTILFRTQLARVSGFLVTMLFRQVLFGLNSSLPFVDGQGKSHDCQSRLPVAQPRLHPEARCRWCVYESTCVPAPSVINAFSFADCTAGRAVIWRLQGKLLRYLPSTWVTASYFHVYSTGVSASNCGVDCYDCIPIHLVATVARLENVPESRSSWYLCRIFPFPELASCFRES